MSIAFTKDDFEYTARLLRSDDDAIVTATLSNNINVILCALDAIPNLQDQCRIWSGHYDIVKAGEDEAREQVETLRTALRNLVSIADEDELGGWPNNEAFHAARAVLESCPSGPPDAIEVGSKSNG